MSTAPAAEITYAIETALDPAEFVDVMTRSTLAERRPLDDPDRVARMCRNANLIVTARDRTGLLVGIARSVTDYSLCCYVSDLAVDTAWQKRGIGRELLERTRQAAGGKEILLLLLSAPAAMEYYPKIGFERMENAFAIRYMP